MRIGFIGLGNLGSPIAHAIGRGTGAYQGTADQKRVIDNCLRGRGYNVLN